MISSIYTINCAMHAQYMWDIWTKCGSFEKHKPISIFGCSKIVVSGGNYLFEQEKLRHRVVPEKYTLIEGKGLRIFSTDPTYLI